jgi:hypothetical protein
MADAESDALQIALRDDLRRFWSRFVYFMGMMAGLLPLITLPANLFTISTTNPAIVALAQVINAATVLPASALAYWQRRVASIWLIVDAAMGIFARIEHPLKGTENWALFGVLGVGIPLFLGVFGLVTEWTGWPSLLEKKKAQSVKPSVRRGV